MDLFSELMVFAKVVEKGSFSGAAAALNIAKSSVSKKVAALENKHGLTLIQRTTRQIHITEEGYALYQHCLRLQEDLVAAKAQLSQLTGKPQGRLRISAPPLFGQTCLSPHLPKFLHQYPDIELDLQLTDSYSNLVAEGYDMLIRMGEQPDSSMIAQRLTNIPPVLCASKDYLDLHGTPKTPADLEHHNCIIWQRSGHPAQMRWPFHRNQQRQELNVTGNFTSNDIIAIKQAVCGGVGISILPSYVVQEELTDGTLTLLLPDYHQSEIPFYVLYSQHTHHMQISTKHRVFIEFLKGLF